MHIGGFYEVQEARKNLRQHCDLYVVRVLPDGSKPHDASEPGPAVRFGNSKPCVRCLNALGAAGVRRVVFSTGDVPREGALAYEVRTVQDLLDESAREGGHSSRGDLSSCDLLQRGALRRHAQRAL